MASVAVSFDFSRYSDRLDELTDNLDDLDEVMDEAAQYLVRSVVNRLLRSKREPKSGTRWRELKQSTIDIKGHESILFHTGELARSIGVDRSAVDGFTISAGADHAAYMQYGVSSTSGMIKGKRIPARPFMGFSEANKRRIARMLLDHIDGVSDSTYGEAE